MEGRRDGGRERGREGRRDEGRDGGTEGRRDGERGGWEGGREVLNRVLGIQYLDPWRACTLFLLLRRLSPEGTMSTRLTHDLGCNWTDRVSPQSALMLEVLSSNGKI
jgi:hypothetical protein